MIHGGSSVRYLHTPINQHLSIPTWHNINTQPIPHYLYIPKLFLKSNPTIYSSEQQKDGQILQKEILQKKDCWARYTYIVSWLELYLEGGVLTFFLLPVFQQSTPLFTICSGCLIKISAEDECQLCRIVTVVNTKHPVQGPSSLVRTKGIFQHKPVIIIFFCINCLIPPAFYPVPKLFSSFPGWVLVSRAKFLDEFNKFLSTLLWCHTRVLASPHRVS